jgi:PAS domain S-box-containing protein
MNLDFSELPKIFAQTADNRMSLIMWTAIITAVIVVILLLAIWYIIRKRSGSVGDVGNSGQLEAALRDEKLKSSIVVNAIEDGVILFDHQYMIRSFNPAAATITGWKSEDAQNLQLDNVLKVVNSKGEQYPAEKNPIVQAFILKRTMRVNDAELLTSANKRVPINLSVSPLLEDGNKDGKAYAAVAVFRDVTKERAEESQRAEFISTASHEMRTPVAAIEGYLALALNDKVSTIDSRARDYLEKAHTSTQHLGKLFQDLLTSAKAEDGRLASHPVVIEMGDYLQQLSEDLRFAAQKKNLAMEFVIGSTQVINARQETSDGSVSGSVVKPLYYVKADADRLREVITNLFDNATKYTEAGKISMGLTGNNDVVQFYIKDTGPGIPPEDVPHLFQKFYRVDNSATRTIGGTGLGLFICRKIVELYSGRIWVESQMGQGSTFYINLPRLNAKQVSELQASEAAAKAGGLPAINSLTATP